MYFLFNASADQKAPAQPRDIWLTHDGNPAFATQLSKVFGDIPTGAKLTGKIDAEETHQYRLTNDGKLTESGETYCAIMGVEKSVDSLTKFVTVSNPRRTQVKLDVLFEQQPAMA